VVLSKLQQLSLEKQAAHSNTPKSLASLARSAQAQRSVLVGSTGPSNHTEAAEPAAKPLSKLALLSSKGRTTSATQSAAKPSHSPTGLSKLARKAQASRATSLQPKPDSPKAVDAPPSWDIATQQSKKTLKATKPSHFASVLLDSNGTNAIGMHRTGSTNSKVTPLFGSAFKFDTPSPDEVIMQARKGTSLAPRSPPK